MNLPASSPAPASIAAYAYPDEIAPPNPWDAWWETPPAPSPLPVEPDNSALVAHLEEEKKQAFEAGRMQGIDEGRALEREVHAGDDQQRAQQIERLAEAFAGERGRILHQLEDEVVRLALAIAARILRREAQTDPLLLTGAVRVALGQLAASSHVRLRVPAAEEGLWTEWVAMVPNLRTRITVEPVETMRVGECALESEVGSVDLGVRAQLREVDRAFFGSSAPSESGAPAAGSSVYEGTTAL